ncbi:DUF4348 domain-containing protein [Rurimicrobium arvi]|uniref:DUF4348 domain-containing protein n=1 Tax=Rurimicrobium arvi TaxID=2049916 RepID=A0ABP8MGQ5_9BACT
MKRLIIILVVLVGNTSCADKAQNLEQKFFKETDFIGTKELEDFDSFLNRFSSDSIFQTSRILFPITSSLYDIDNGQTDTERITRNEWTFSNLKSTGFVLKVYKSEKVDTLNIQGKETGISVNYIFELIDGKWMLVK